jgi:hypothetical protein
LFYSGFKGIGSRFAPGGFNAGITLALYLNAARRLCCGKIVTTFGELGRDTPNDLIGIRVSRCRLLNEASLVVIDSIAVVVKMAISKHNEMESMYEQD